MGSIQQLSVLLSRGIKLKTIIKNLSEKPLPVIFSLIDDNNVNWSRKNEFTSS